MRFMNEYDIESALNRFYGPATPHRARLAQTVANLAEWTNRNSDGWAYWPKPCRAAAKAMEEIDPTDWASEDAMRAADCTEAEFKAALRPIKAFLTKHGVAHEQVIV